jgi:hypothetical protein
MRSCLLDDCSLKMFGHNGGQMMSVALDGGAIATCEGGA